MTKEKALELINHKLDLACDDALIMSDTEYEVLQICAKALEQEPCEDAISRQAVLSLPRNRTYTLAGVSKNESIDVDLIEALPSVTPQPKISHWIMKHRTHNEIKHYTGQDEMGETHTISVLERYEVDEPYCSECGKLAGDTSQNYCCACGAKMEV